MIYGNLSVDRDGNGAPIFRPFPFRVKKTITFDGGTLNGIGDIDGTSNPLNMFTITGDVLISIFGIVKVDMVSAGAATIIYGTTSGDDLTNLEDYSSFDVGGSAIWSCVFAPAVAAGVSSTTDIVKNSSALEAGILPPPIILSNDAITFTVATADISAGVIDFYCLWAPISDDAEIVAA